MCSYNINSNSIKMFIRIEMNLSKCKNKVVISCLNMQQNLIIENIIITYYYN